VQLIGVWVSGGGQSRPYGWIGCQMLSSGQCTQKVRSSRAQQAGVQKVRSNRAQHCRCRRKEGSKASFCACQAHACGGGGWCQGAGAVQQLGVKEASSGV